MNKSELQAKDFLEKVKNIHDIYDELINLKKIIAGFTDIITSPSSLEYKIYGDSNEITCIRGVDCDIVKNAFNKANEVFSEEYQNKIDKLNELLKQ